MRELFEDRELKKFLMAAFLWVILLGVFMWSFRIRFQSPLGFIVMSVFYMLSPAFIVAWLHGFQVKLMAEKYGLLLNKQVLVKILFYSTAFLLIYILLYLAFSFILGKIPVISSWFGHISFIPADYKNEFYKVTRARGNVAIPGFWGLLATGIAGAFIAGITVNGLFALGEEIAWRGFLQEKLANAGETGAAIITGIIWGLWHAPVILLGYNFPESPVAGVGYMLLVTLPMSFLLGMAVRKSGTVWTAAVMHGMFNALPFLNIIVTGKIVPFGGIMGVTGAVSMLVTWKIMEKLSARIK